MTGGIQKIELIYRVNENMERMVTACYFCFQMNLSSATAKEMRMKGKNPGASVRTETSGF